MEQLEIGEHVDLDSGIMVRRESEDEYYIRVGGEHRNSVTLTESQIQAIAQLTGFIGLPLEQSEW